MRSVIFVQMGVFAVYIATAFLQWEFPLDFSAMGMASRADYLFATVIIGAVAFVISWATSNE